METRNTLPGLQKALTAFKKAAEVFGCLFQVESRYPNLQYISK